MLYGYTIVMRKTLSMRARRRDRKVMPPTLRYRTPSNSTSRGRKGARLRMRPWLELLLDSQKCSILRWEDRAEKKFSIAWRHASSHGFDPSRHSDLFHMWAEHTGKLKRIPRINHSGNKSTFRCALHSLKDCIELTKTGDKRGEGAKRTYQFIEPGHHLYDRKRKRASQKGNKILPTEEASVSSHDFQEDASSNSDYLSAEGNTAVLNMATSSHDIPEHINQSYLAVSGGHVISPSSASPHPVATTSLDFLTPGATSDSDPETHESPHELMATEFLTAPKMYSELQPNGVVSLVIEPMNCGVFEPDSITCKEEPRTPKLPDFAALDIPDVYEDLDCINNRSLCCGGNVKVKHSKQDTLSQPAFEIDLSLIKNLPPQQLLLPSQQQVLPPREVLLPSQQQLPSIQELLLQSQQLLPPERYVAESSVTDYECPAAVTCVDVSTEHMCPEQSVDSNFLHNQHEENHTRVLIELQPMIDESNYAALEVAYELGSVWSSDIFSLGAC